MSKQRRYRSSKLAQKKKKQKIIKISVWSTLFLSILIGLSYWSGKPSVTISQIVVSENEFLDDERIINDVTEMLQGRYFFLFARSNSLIIPRGEIKKYILENYTSVEEVNVRVKGFDVVNIDVVEHGSLAKWCGFDFNTPTDCYLINTDGLIFAKENVMDVKNIPAVYGVHESEENILGKTYLDVDTYSNIMTFVSNLDQLDIKAIFVDTEDQETFAIYTARGPYLLIEKGDDSNEVLNNLKTVIETEELSGAQYENLEYIDLRFGKKVYYKIH